MKVRGSVSNIVVRANQYVGHKSFSSGCGQAQLKAGYVDSDFIRVVCQINR